MAARESWSAWWSRRLVQWTRFGRGPVDNSLGRRGEAIAEAYLTSQGMKLVGRRVKVGRGDIDLIMLDGQTLVFVEVKTRATDQLGSPFEAVDAVKQRKLTHWALRYLKRTRQLHRRARFDVVGVICDDRQSGAVDPSSIDHRRNAFEPTGRGQFFS